MKVRIFQPIVPEYRVALFEGLSAAYNGDVEIWASEKWISNDLSVPLKHCKFDYNHQVIKIGPFVWQLGFSLHGLDSKDSVVVVSGDVHQLSSLWLAFLCKIRHIPVVWWGHHVSVGSTGARIAIRLFLAKHLSDVILCYTEQGVRWYQKRGWKGAVFATGNTINTDDVKAAICFWTASRLEAFKREHNLSRQEAIVFCSVLRWKTHLEQLLRAMASETLKRRGVKLIIVGDGEGRSTWERMADDLGLNDRVVWVGALHDQMKIAPWFLSSSAYVYPGPIGLSIIHAFSYGLPVVCHDNAGHHGPEFEAMADGETGFVFKEDDEIDLERKIIKVLSDESRRVKMSRHVRSIVEERYGIDAMVNNFSKAVQAAIMSGKDR